MKIEIIKKETINVEKFEIKVADKIYIIYVFPKSNYDFIEFYVTEEDSSIMSFCRGVQQEDITPSIEEFINDNIIKWINDYNIEADIIDHLF